MRKFKIKGRNRLYCIGLLCSAWLSAQNLTGTLTQHLGQQISLTGFNYYKSEMLATATVDSLGHFTLNYPKEYNGMAVLKTEDNSSLVLMLTEPNTKLTGIHLQDPNTLSFLNSAVNSNLMLFAKAQGLRNNAQSALQYLEDLYQKNILFSRRKKLKKIIRKEKHFLKKEETDFIAKLNPDDYLRWFIPQRKLVQEMPRIVRKDTALIPQAIFQFRTTEFNDPKFKSSGLFKQLLEGHYLLLENMGQSMDSMYTQMNLSTEYLITNLQNNDSLLNTVGDELFNFFEKRSLYTASAHLSKRLLSDKRYNLKENLASKLERYRRMKVGNIAPDITLGEQKLSTIKTNKLVVFGASWCPYCTKELTGLVKYRQEWEKKKVEIIYLSIDTDPTAFEKTFNELPWKSYCDFKGWETQSAKDYFITATPSYFLLDENNQILVRPNSVEHAQAFIQYKL